jgi:hypothetical protein
MQLAYLHSGSYLWHRVCSPCRDLPVGFAKGLTGLCVSTCISSATVSLCGPAMYKQFPAHVRTSSPAGTVPNRWHARHARLPQPRRQSQPPAASVVPVTKKKNVLAAWSVSARGERQGDTCAMRVRIDDLSRRAWPTDVGLAGADKAP